MEFNTNVFVAFILFLFPLIGTFSFCGRLLKKKLLEDKILNGNAHSKAMILLKLSPIAILMIISLLLMAFDFFICFVTYVKISMWLKIIGYFGLLSFWLFFGSLCMGLHKVIGAGFSSSGKIIKSISDDINEEIDKSIEKHAK